MKFENLKIDDEFVYDNIGVLAYWKVTSNEYKKGNGYYKDIIMYKYFQRSGNLKIKKETISRSRIKREGLGVGDSGRLERNRKTFFNILFNGYDRKYIIRK